MWLVTDHNSSFWHYKKSSPETCFGVENANKCDSWNYSHQMCGKIGFRSRNGQKVIQQNWKHKKNVILELFHIKMCAKCGFTTSFVMLRRGFALMSKTWIVIGDRSQFKFLHTHFFKDYTRKLFGSKGRFFKVSVEIVIH